MASDSQVATPTLGPLTTAVIEENRHNMRLLAQVADGSLTKGQFREQANQRFTKGQWQFADKSFNIRDSRKACKHACTYCFVTPLLGRFRGNVPLEPVPIEEAFPEDPAKAAKRWAKPKNGPKVIFFPSTHDIFLENVPSYVACCARMIGAGHEIMFVTKPHEAATAEFIRLFDPKLRDKIHTFITITSDDDAVLKHYEPFAAPYAERVRCLRRLFEAGFQTSAMIEPYLTDPRRFVPEVEPFVRQVVAIGSMNYSALGEDKVLDQLYAPEKIRELLAFARQHPKIIFKKELIARTLKAL